MLSKKIEKLLNAQVAIEAEASQFYLAMASWAETQGYNGTAKFLFHHSDEERMHMLKLVHFINERGGHAIVPQLDKPQTNFTSLDKIFQKVLDHEIQVTQHINDIVEKCLDEKDYTTHNFMQWYVSEQIEEESLARDILDKLHMIGNDNAGIYLFDRDLENYKHGGGENA
jgi:ferritin